MGRYLPQLDGLRTVAVLLVIATHTELVPGGYLGVDIFFVLSGYLITSILMRECETGRWSLRAFWQRRIRRLYPALIGMLLLTLPIDGLVITGSIWHRVVVVLLSATYLANLGNLHPTNWMGGLSHTWSLAVEEQFYLVWPLLLPIALRRRGTALLLVVTAVMLGLLAFGSPVFGRLLLGRGGVILAGCALALVLRRRSLPHPPALAAVGAIGVVAAIELAPASTGPQAGMASAAITLPCLILIGGLLEDGILTRWLSSSAMVWLGRRSYGIYLWHLPIMWALARGHLIQHGGIVMTASVAGLSIGASAISYRHLERPFRIPSLAISQA